MYLITFHHCVKYISTQYFNNFYKSLFTDCTFGCLQFLHTLREHLANVAVSSPPCHIPRHAEQIQMVSGGLRMLIPGQRSTLDHETWCVLGEGEKGLGGGCVCSHDTAEGTAWSLRWSPSFLSYLNPQPQVTVAAYMWSTNKGISDGSRK